MTRKTRIQLIVFGLVTVLATGYGAVTILNVGQLVDRPYEIVAEFDADGGIYPRADVELLGTRVGSVREVIPGPGTGTTVVMAIDADEEIAADAKARIVNKSAIGEQFVTLTPQSDAETAVLEEGAVIPASRTSTPIEVSKLLGSLDRLAGSVPTKQLSIVLDETAAAVDGLGPTLRRLISDTDAVTAKSLANVDDLRSLIGDAQTVLNTQVDLGEQTEVSLREVSSLTKRLRELNPSFDALFVNGIRTSTAASNLLSDNQALLPVLLNNLIAVNQVAADNLPELRKTLVLFPWALEISATSVRYCDEYDTETGEPIESTCHYDDQGRPIYSAHLGLQLPELPGNPQYAACTKGYEGTKRYNPDGTPVDGVGPRQRDDSPFNPDARCTAPPDDPHTPNVRGAQNVIDQRAGTNRAAPGFALYDPNSGTVAAPDGVTYRIDGLAGPPPPSGEEGLTWLLTNVVKK